MFRPQIDHGVRGRVVVLARLSSNLLEQHVPHERAERREGEKPIEQTCLALSRFRRDQFFRDISPAVFTGDTVDQADTQRLFRIDRVSRQHDLHAFADAAQLYDTHGAAEARMQAQLHLGQAEDLIVTVRADAVVAHHGNLESAAEANTIDGGNRRAGKVPDAQEHALRHLGQSDDLVDGPEAAELGDIGSHDETAGFPRIHHQTDGYVRLQLRQDGIQFRQDFRRQGVGRGFGLVETQPADAGIVGLQFPVLVHASLLVQAGSKSQTSGRWSEKRTSGTSKRCTLMPSWYRMKSSSLRGARLG